MDLYSIEGKKITGPLEVIHGLTYVAVIPPEEFIQADYYTYLMKASRSWQKRRTKRNNVNNQSEKDNNEADTSININIQSNSTINNVMATDNTKFIEKELANIEYNSILKRTPNSRQKRVADNNPKHTYNNQPIVKKYRNTSKEETINVIQPNKKINTRSGRNFKYQKQNVSPSQKVPKGIVRTKVPNKDNNTLNNKINISRAKPDNIEKTTQNRKDSTNQSIENLVHQLETDNITDSDSHITHSIKAMLSEEFIVKSPNTTIIKPLNSKYGISLNTYKPLEKDNKETQEKVTRDISVKRGGVVNLRLNIRVNDHDISNDRNNNYNIKITQSNSSFVTEKASQVNVDFNINVAKLNELHTDNHNPNIVLLHSLNDQSLDKDVPLEEENDNMFYVLPAERGADQFKSCNCEDDEILKNNEQMSHAVVATGKVPRSMGIDFETEPINSTTNDPDLNVEPDDDLQTKHSREVIGIEPKKNVVMLDKSCQTEWIDILLEARYHHDGHYSLHLPPLEVVKNL